jgi:hypothetical protein
LLPPGDSIAIDLRRPGQEETMSQVSTQHPAVVLRSHYVHVRALLATAAIAVVCLSLAVVVLATDDGTDSGSASSATPANVPAMRSDGTPGEKTRGDLLSGRRP